MTLCIGGRGPRALLRHPPGLLGQPEAGLYPHPLQPGFQAILPVAAKSILCTRRSLTVTAPQGQVCWTLGSLPIPRAGPRVCRGRLLFARAVPSTCSTFLVLMDKLCIFCRSQTMSLTLRPSSSPARGEHDTVSLMSVLTVLTAVVILKLHCS